MQQYERFAEERARPFHELLARVPPDLAPRVIVDLGCGPGRLTATLQTRWPGAQVCGIDSSEAMLEAARAGAKPHGLSFTRGDLAHWRAEAPVDLIVSNAALHWVEDHAQVLARWSGSLRPGGVVAFQVPGNFSAPSHRLLYALTDSPVWADRLSRIARGAVLPLGAYVRLLQSLGLQTDAWQTTYLHVLEGEKPVLEWMKGTTLRPILAALCAREKERFLAAYGEALEQSYPSHPGGVIFPFTRLFVVARRAAGDPR